MKGVREREHTWLTGRLLSCERRWLPGWGTGTNSRCIAPGFYAALQRLERKNLTGVHFVEEILFCLRPMAKGPSIYLIFLLLVLVVLDTSLIYSVAQKVSKVVCLGLRVMCIQFQPCTPTPWGQGAQMAFSIFMKTLKKQSCSGPSK